MFLLKPMGALHAATVLMATLMLAACATMAQPPKPCPCCESMGKVCSCCSGMEHGSCCKGMKPEAGMTCNPAMKK